MTRFVRSLCLMVLLSTTVFFSVVYFHRATIVSQRLSAIFGTPIQIQDVKIGWGQTTLSEIQSQNFSVGSATIVATPPSLLKHHIGALSLTNLSIQSPPEASTLPAITIGQVVIDGQKVMNEVSLTRMLEEIHCSY